MNLIYSNLKGTLKQALKATLGDPYRGLVLGLG